MALCTTISINSLQTQPLAQFGILLTVKYTRYARGAGLASQAQKSLILNSDDFTSARSGGSNDLAGENNAGTYPVLDGSDGYSQGVGKLFFR